jgi:hypothetical protein
VTQLQTALPTLLTQQLEARSPGSMGKVCAQDETRRGLLPVVRRRITTRGVQPRAPVTYQFENFSMALWNRPPGRVSFSNCRTSTVVRSNGGWTALPLPFQSR